MAKYESVTKTHRNASIALIRRKHPELTLAEIGRAFGISGQRVSVILRRARERDRLLNGG